MAESIGYADSRNEVTLEPALNTEVFLEQFFGLSNNGKTKADSTLAFLQIMAMANEYEI